MTSPTLFGIAVICGTLIILFLAARRTSSQARSSLEPPKIKGYLPWIGCVLGMMDPGEFGARCTKRYGPAFTGVMMGKKITFITSAPLIASLYKHSRAATHDPIRLEIPSPMFGISKGAAADIRLEHEAWPLLTKYFSFQNSKVLSKSFAEGFYARLSTTAVFQSAPSAVTEIKLQQLLFPLLYASTSTALFGPSFPAEQTFDDFQAFDHQILTLLSGASFLAPRALAARKRLHKAISTFTKQNWETDMSSEHEGNLVGACDLVSEVSGLLRQWNMTEEDQAGHLLTLLWASQPNVTWSLFWLLVYVLRDPNATARLRAELEEGMRVTFSSNVASVLEADPTEFDAKRFPLLDSALKETHRLATSVASMRRIVDDVMLSESGGSWSEGGSTECLLLKGQDVLALTRVVHMDPEIYENPEVFKVDRFLDDDGVSPRKFYKRGRLIQNHLMPWGGGSSKCEGRYYATHALKLCAVLFFHHFDMEMLSTVDARGSARSDMPRMDMSRIGVLPSPDDCMVAFRRKANV